MSSLPAPAQSLAEWMQPLSLSWHSTASATKSPPFLSFTIWGWSNSLIFCLLQLCLPSQNWHISNEELVFLQIHHHQQHATKSWQPFCRSWSFFTCNLLLKVSSIQLAKLCQNGTVVMAFLLCRHFHSLHNQKNPFEQSEESSLSEQIPLCRFTLEQTHFPC